MIRPTLNLGSKPFVFDHTRRQARPLAEFMEEPGRIHCTTIYFPDGLTGQIFGIQPQNITREHLDLARQDARPQSLGVLADLYAHALGLAPRNEYPATDE